MLKFEIKKFFYQKVAYKKKKNGKYKVYIFYREVEESPVKRKIVGTDVPYRLLDDIILKYDK